VARTKRSELAKRRRRKETGLAALFLAPSAIVLGLFAFYPFIKTIQTGLYRQTSNGRFREVGISQYSQILTSDEFLTPLWRSILYVIYTVPFGLILGTLLAVAANRKLRGIKVFQTIFSSTIATSVAVASVVFYVLLNPSIGVLQVDVLNNPKWALFAVAQTSTWQYLGLSFVIVLAGLQAIPDELLEAAALDGYGPVRRFFKVTLPLLTPVLLFLLVVLVIYAFQAFAPIQILTNGSPNHSTETLIFQIFSNRNDHLGTAAVLSVGLFAMTFVVTLLQFLILDRRVHYGN
jgi:sn-glycerol 3-phosphate transport system permease protein